MFRAGGARAEDMESGELVSKSSRKSDSDNDLQLLLECLRFQQHCIPAQKQALTTIAVMCSNSSSSRNLFNTSGGLAFVLELLYSTQSPEIQQASMYTLGCASENNVTNQLKLCNEQLFTFLVGLLTTEPPEVAEPRLVTDGLTVAIAFLAGCLMSSNAQGQNMSRGSKLLSKLILLFKSHLPSPPTNEWNDESSTANGGQYSHRLWSSVCSALCTATNNPQNETNQCQCSMLIPAALSLLELTPLNPHILRPAISLLTSCIANNRTAQDRLRLVGGLQSLVQTLREIVNKTKSEQQESDGRTAVNELALHIVKSLSAAAFDHSDNCKVLVDLKYVRILLNLLLCEGLDQSTKLNVVLCLGMLTEDNTDSQRQVAEADGMHLLLEVMASSQSEELIKAVTFVLQCCVNQTKYSESRVEDANFNKKVAIIDQQLQADMENHHTKLSSETSMVHKNTDKVILELLDGRKVTANERVSHWLHSSVSDDSTVCLTSERSKDALKNLLVNIPVAENDLRKEFISEVNKLKKQDDLEKVETESICEETALKSDLLHTQAEAILQHEKMLRELLEKQLAQEREKRQELEQKLAEKMITFKEHDTQPVDGFSQQNSSSKHGHLPAHTKDKSIVDSHLIPQAKDKSIVDSHFIPQAKDKSITDSHLMTHTKDKSIAASHLTAHTKDEAIADNHLTAHANDKSIADSHLTAHTKDKSIADSHLIPQTKDKSITDSHLMTRTKDKSIADSHLTARTKEKAIVDNHFTPPTKDKLSHIKTPQFSGQSNVRYATSAYTSRGIHGLLQRTKQNQHVQSIKGKPPNTCGNTHPLLGHMYMHRNTESITNRYNQKSVKDGVEKKKRPHQETAVEKSRKRRCASTVCDTESSAMPDSQSSNQTHMSCKQTTSNKIPQTPDVCITQSSSKPPPLREGGYSFLSHRKEGCDHHCLACKPRLKCPLITSRTFVKLLCTDSFTCAYHQRFASRMMSGGMPNIAKSVVSKPSSVCIHPDQISTDSNERLSTTDSGNSEECNKSPCYSLECDSVEDEIIISCKSSADNSESEYVPSSSGSDLSSTYGRRTRNSSEEDATPSSQDSGSKTCCHNDKDKIKGPDRLISTLVPSVYKLVPENYKPFHRVRHPHKSSVLKDITNQSLDGVEACSTVAENRLEVYNYSTPDKTRRTPLMRKTAKNISSTDVPDPTEPTARTTRSGSHQQKAVKISKERIRWTKEEEKYLREGVALAGPGQWRHILTAFPFHSSRDGGSLKDKYRNMLRMDKDL